MEGESSNFVDHSFLTWKTQILGGYSRTEGRWMTRAEPKRRGQNTEANSDEREYKEWPPLVYKGESTTLDSGFTSDPGDICSVFAKQVSRKSGPVQQWEVCARCNEFSLARMIRKPNKEELIIDVARSKPSGETCRLHDFLRSRIPWKKKKKIESVQVKVYAEVSTDTANDRKGLSSKLPRLCIKSVPQGENVDFSMEYPLLPEPASELYFALINKWVRVCNNNHDHTKCFMSKLPRRVLDVGDGPESSTLRLYDTGGCAVGRYIALSHRWGESYEQISTMRTNVAKREKEIDITNLPRVFQDAICVARNLRVQFIWVDSLCIIQDDENDWARESVRMEDVYASSYLTIGATSATDSDGFLYRRPENFVRFEDNDAGVLAYICKEWSFHGDVEEGALNQRGWVLQERALSRRMIHFTAGQVYWECGSMRRCETTDEVLPRRLEDRGDLVNLLGASEFPRMTPVAPRIYQRKVFKEVFSKYSSMALTRPSDRPVAIAGLELRLSDFYDTESVCGIVKEFFLESLLWFRAHVNLKPIADINSKIRDCWPLQNDAEVSSWSWVADIGRNNYYAPVDIRPQEDLVKGNEGVPSWSWMAYTGAIKYVDITVGFPLPGGVGSPDLPNLGHVVITYDPKGYYVLIAPLMRLIASCRIDDDRSSGNCFVENEEKERIGSIRYDHFGDSLDSQRISECFLVTKTNWPSGTSTLYGDPYRSIQARQSSHVVIVERVLEKRYRRRGVACINSEYLEPVANAVSIY